MSKCVETQATDRQTGARDDDEGEHEGARLVSSCGLGPKVCTQAGWRAQAAKAAPQVTWASGADGAPVCRRGGKSGAHSNRFAWLLARRLLRPTTTSKRSPASHHHSLDGSGWNVAHARARTQCALSSCCRQRQPTNQTLGPKPAGAPTGAGQ